MSYLVFARKYRPQSFADVLGQEHVANTLRNAIQGDRIAHAYLFSGPRGVGKTTMARLLAKAVNCLRTPGPDPCGECEACKAIATGEDIDVLEIDAASNRKVDEVQPLIEAARYLPQRSPRKIFIVDEVHMLSTTAFNALLKTLEEPPPHALFILATTEPHKIPETVRSRCQRFDFKRISRSDIERKLQRIVDEEHAAVDPAVLEEIARRATGGLRDAESLLDQVIGAAPADGVLKTQDLVAILGGVPRDVRSDLLERARAGDMAGVLARAEEVVEAGADPGDLLRDLYGDLRDKAVAAACGAETSGCVEWCLAAAEIVSRHLSMAARSRAGRASLDLALLALTRLGDVADLEDLVDRLERLEGGGSPRPPERRVQEPAPAEDEPAAPSPRAGGAFSQLRARLKGRAPASGAEGESSPPPARALVSPREPAENDAPAARAGPASLSMEELARIQALPAVRTALQVFSGRIEQVRRNEDG